MSNETIEVRKDKKRTPEEERAAIRNRQRHDTERIQQAEAAKEGLPEPPHVQAGDEIGPT